MAKDTFFLRGQVICAADQNRDVAEIDLGAFVNLGTTKPQVLRIHSIQVAWTDEQGLVPSIDAAAAVGDAKSAFSSVALTTKATPLANPAIPMLNDDETVFSAAVVGSNLNNDVDQGIMTASTDLAPQHLVNGYLVGVDTLYLYGIADNGWAETLAISICMECSTEAVSKDSAIGLALSQA
jgi:hypothetical protein